MGTRENKVEKYLDKEVEKLGGITRKWVSPGRDGVPDRIIIIEGIVEFVETKTTDGKLTVPQTREIDELTRNGTKCHVVYGHTGVDAYINRLKAQLIERELFL
jgi:hypothetical protein